MVIELIKIERNRRSIYDRRKRVDWILVKFYIKSSEFRHSQEFTKGTTQEDMMVEVAREIQKKYTELKKYAE